MLPTTTATLWLLGLAAVAAPETPRASLDLNGTWECQVVAELGDAPPAEGWRKCEVPGYLSGFDGRGAWFRREFDVPPSMRGSRVTLRFGGVKYNSRVYVNGQAVGGCFGGYEPFALDVTDALRWDGPNRLAVACRDWTGVFSPGPLDFGDASRTKEIRSLPDDRILSPVGGLFALYGIWDDVRLESHPAVTVADCFIQPSVRRKELVVRTTLANSSSADVEVTLATAVETAASPSQEVLRLPEQSVRIPAGETVAVTVRGGWADPRCWSPDDPYLYFLRSSLSTGDAQRTRFGFREFWVEGHHFYLNGTKINLLASSGWPPHGAKDRQAIRDDWLALRRAGCVAFRTHTQPWPSRFYDVADEVGLLMVIEGAVWNDDDTYRIHDPAFWENYARHLRAMVERDKNRPSVVMWSLENEFYGGRLNDASPAKDELVRMGRIVKQCDPTRPIEYESDGDPGGVADVINIHYPHEYPEFTCWPNEATWLDTPQPIGAVFRDAHLFPNGTDFHWQRQKPLYVGEFLWLPSRDPSWHTVFFGDEAYRDYQRYRDLGKAESWKMQVLGYRHLEVAGISPWTVTEGGPLDETNALYRAHQYIYQHVAAYAHDYDRRFYSGERVGRRLEVFNDIAEPSELTLAWTLRQGERAVHSGSEQLTLDPADHRMLDVALQMPEVDARTELVWQVTLNRLGKEVFRDEHAYSVFPRPEKLPTAEALALYDPRGATAKWLAAAGAKVRPIDDLAAVGSDGVGAAVLVVGEGAFQPEAAARPVIGRVDPRRAALDRFVDGGGRVLILRQEVLPPGLFDVSLSEHASTMTFPQHVSHPALRGLRADDFRFWRGDHLVTAREIVRPTAGPGQPLVFSGSSAGLAHCPLLEMPAGRGTIVFSQMRLVDKADAEPAAGRLLLNVLEYLAGYRPRARRTALVGADDSLRDALSELGVEVETEASAGPPTLVICGSRLPDLARMRAYVERGGMAWIHRADPAGLARIDEAFGLDLVLQPYSGSVVRAETGGRWLESVTGEDLYWLGPHRGHDWAETPRAGEMTDGVFSLSLEGKQATAYEAEDWKLAGQIVERRAGGVTFATAGTASAEIDFPADATYVLGLRARGTPCEGIWPMAEIRIDGERWGTVSVTGSEWGTHTLFGPVAAGRRAVQIAFVNDGSRPPREDRNLMVERLLVARVEASGCEFLTSPPAVAAVPLGKGWLVLDQVRWDTEQANALKAGRFASGLLGAMGAAFRSSAATTLECEAMAPDPKMPHFTPMGSYVSMACSGYLETSVEVARAGTYEAEVLACGTPLDGVYPEVEIRLGGQALGKVQLTGDAWRRYRTRVELPSGVHPLRIVFTNDANRGSEDRNLRLDKVVFRAVR